MITALTQLIDRAVIRIARLHLEKRLGGESHLAAAQALLETPDFFSNDVKPPAQLDFAGGHDFSCNSPIEGASGASRRIYGKFYRCGDNWRERPVVMMLHGWNGENCYHFLFPLLAYQCRRYGISLMMFQLPCHGRRRARRGAGMDFISSDLNAMVQSTQQSISDARALIGWLKHEGCGPVGVWGMSLGAWLAGLLACKEERLDFGILMTPISRMDRAIEELEFCAPIRHSLNGTRVSLRGLNLPEHRPLMDRRNLLLIEGRHDLFAPSEWVEELRDEWGGPPIARFPHGHISILMSPAAMLCALRFIRDRVRTVPS